MGGGGGSPPSSPPPSSPPPSSPSGNGSGGNNKPKCEKCGVNDATTEFKLTVNGETKILILCNPCCEELDKCRICKTEKSKHAAKNGSYLCDKCYYCSKCKANEAIADRIVNDFVDDNNRGQVLYEGAICEVCIKELKQKAKKSKLDKCKVCQKDILQCPMLPSWAMENGKQIMCVECINKRAKEEKQKATDQSKKPANLDLCKDCNKELPWRQEGNIIITKHIFLKSWYLNGNTERHGSFCRPCAEEFKRNHQQTCFQCGKREFPEMKKGWALDFENQAVFCSYNCRSAYLEKQANDDDGVNRYESYVSGGISGAVYPNVELFPDEVELDGDVKDKSFDWEKETDKKEIQNLKEFSKELKRKVDKSNSNPELSEKEKKMLEYFLKLVENSKQKAEKNFEKSYGKSELEALLANSNQEQQTKKNYWPLAIGVGLVGAGAIAGLIYYFWNKKKPLK